MTIGIIGVGHLATALLEGFLLSGMDPEEILLSPRGKAAQLSARWGLPMATDNYDLVTRADLVLLAVRPLDAQRAIAGLPWRDGQTLLSLCAGVPRSALNVAPASTVRAMPLTAAAINASPTACFPPVPKAMAILERLGPVIPLHDEAQFDLATVNAAIYGWAQDLVRQSADWMTAQGADAKTARRLASLTFVAAGRLTAESSESLEGLIAELVTPGGITELGLDVLARRQQPEAWQAACDAVHQRLKGRRTN